MACNHHHHASAAGSYPELNYGAGNKWVKSLTRSRLDQFEGGHYSDLNISSVLYHHRIDNVENVKLQVYVLDIHTQYRVSLFCRWSAPGLTKPTFEEAMKQKFKPAKKGDRFGPSCRSYVSFQRLLTLL